MKDLYPTVVCFDGFLVSVQASRDHCCYPRVDVPVGGYTHVELGFPSESDALILEYAENPETPTDTVYSYVPARVIKDLIAKHGGTLSNLPPLNTKDI